jgi:CHAD domain-containing protein
VALHEQRAQALAALGTTLDSKRGRRLLERLAAFADSRAPVGRGARLGDVAPDLLRPHVRAVVRAGRRLGPDAEAAELHRLRVRTKRLRYALETLRSLGDRSTRELLGRLERLQDTLGKGQDAVTAIAWLRELAATRGVPASALPPTGALIQALARRVQKQRRRALKAWRRLERTRLLDSVLKELAAAGSPPREAARA